MAPEEVVSGGALAALRHVLGLLDGLSDLDWHPLSGAEMHEAVDLLEQVDRRVEAARSELLTATDADGTWALNGPRSFQAWLRNRTGSTRARAAADVRRARSLRDHLPVAGDALRTGQVGRDHIAVLVREALRTQPLRDQLRDPELGEAFLVEHGCRMDAGTFTTLVKSWAVAADPEAADRAWREADTREELYVSRTLDGYHVTGWLDEASGQLVNTALDAQMGRRGADDARTSAQRRAGALVTLAHRVLDSGELSPHARIRPHITVTATWETLRALAESTGSTAPDDVKLPEHTMFSSGTCSGGTRGAEQRQGDQVLPGTDGAGDADRNAGDEAELAWMADWTDGDDHVISTAIDHDRMTGVEPALLDDGTPIAPALLARLACDSALARVVFGPESTILDVGREKRIFPPNMTRAIHARDRHCQFPGCDAPPGFGEIHHSLQWYRDNGPTSVEHGVLLCWHHHDWVHARTITIARVSGEWQFYDRHGERILPISGLARITDQPDDRRSTTNPPHTEPPPD